ncbi:MAG: hypothetical protein AB1801_13870 [Chloroflexota bacterium]
MAAKLMNMTQQNTQASAHCPLSEQQVTAGPSKRIVFPGGQATWWHCPACQGWHLFTLIGKETGEAIHNLEIN